MLAEKEDEEYDEEAEDFDALQRKLQFDLEERDDKIYERLIGSKSTPSEDPSSQLAIS